MLRLLVPALPAGVLIVGAYRGSESHSSPFLRRVLEPARLQLGARALDPLVLVGLTDPEVRVLAAALGHAPRAHREPDLSALRAAQGMPFLLGELLSDPELGADAQLGLEQRLIVRVQACSTRARRLLRTLCIAGRPLAPAVAAHAAELEAGIWPSANELCAQRLARWRESDEGRELEPYHDIVRTCIAERAQGAQRVATHRKLAQALDQHSERDVELALTHWLHAGERAEARRCAVRAVERARAMLAWSRAAELYGLVLELSAADDPGRAALHEARGDMLAFAGEHVASGAAYELAASQAVAGRAEGLYRSAAAQLLLGGRVEHGVRLTRRSLAAVGIPFPESVSAARCMWLHGRTQLTLRDLRTRVLGLSRPAPTGSARCEALRAAYRGLTVHDPVRGFALHSRYLAEARGRGDAHEFEALAWEAAHCAIGWGPQARRRVTGLRRVATSISRGSNEPYMQAMSLLLEATYLLACRERPRDAALWLDRAEELLKRCPGTHCERGWLHMLRDYTTLAAAEVDLHGYLLTRERESRDRDDAYTHKQLLVTLPQLHMMEDCPDRALAFLQSRWPQVTPASGMFDFLALSGRLDVLLYQRDAAAAYALLKASTRSLTFKLAPPSILNHVAYLRARGAVALYAQTQRSELASEVRRVARVRASLPRLSQGLFRGLLASVAIADGDHAQAGALLAGACADLVATQHDNLAWLARYRMAQLRGNAGELEQAETWLRARGIREPERWVSVVLPVKPGFARARSRALRPGLLHESRAGGQTEPSLRAGVQRGM
jgi:eukaryotic-like serine/threonine-protein kinase